jgi:hypothetical protein
MKRIALPLALLLSAVPALAEPVLPPFDPANFDQGAAITNPWFPLASGYVREYAGMVAGEDGNLIEERVLLAYVGPGPVIAGVQTVMVLDNAWAGGRHVEEAKDYYAQDRDGNVWYMGEDVSNFTYDAAGVLTGTDDHGTWRAGVKDALPGFAMPADPQPGLVYFQEHAAADEALDVGEIMALDAGISGPTGDFAGVLAVFETSLIEPDLREVKYYAKGVGLVRVEEGVDADPEAASDLVRRLD